MKSLIVLMLLGSLLFLDTVGAQEGLAQEPGLRSRVLDLRFHTEELKGAVIGLEVKETATEIKIELSGDILFDFDKWDIRPVAEPTNERSYQDALKYLRLLQQIEPLMQQVNHTLNDLRQKDIELFNKWADYQQVCQEYESCRGGDPASCESLQPAWAPTPTTTAQ